MSKEVVVIRRFRVRIPGRICCPVGPTARRLTTDYSIFYMLFIITFNLVNTIAAVCTILLLTMSSLILSFMPHPWPPEEIKSVPPGRIVELDPLHIAYILPPSPSKVLFRGLNYTGAFCAVDGNSSQDGDF